MKLKIIFVVLLLVFYNSYAQVGINTETPLTTLDVTAKNPSGTGTNVEGMLIPRIDRQKAQSMAAIPVSTLIYISNATTGSAAGSAVNIDTVGYYFYNGTVWVKLDTNIYNVDGSLAGNRVVSQNANTLSFTGTAVNAFSIDGSTFSVNAAANRVGIGTNNPSTVFEVVGGHGGEMRVSSGTGNSRWGFETRDNTGPGGSDVLNITNRSDANNVRAMTFASNGNAYIGGGLVNDQGANYALITVDNVNSNVKIGDTPNGGADMKLVVNPGNSTTSGAGIQVTQGDVYVQNSKYGIILKSPNGSCRRVTMNDLGVLTTSAVITCP